MNLDKFFTLLMGKCWHEFFNGSKYVTDCIHCKHHYGDAGDNPDHLSNPLPVLEWMRENMADTLEQALAFIWQDYEITETFTVGIFRILNLQNLAAYLIEHPEWGETKCPECNGWGTEICYNPDHGFIRGIGYGDISRMGCPCCGHDEHNRIRNTVCKKCNGSGTILHPALEYAKGEKE